MKQTIGNACGTVALIHCVANNREQVNIGTIIITLIMFVHVIIYISYVSICA